MDTSSYEPPLIATRVNTIVLAFTVISGLVVFLRLFARVILTSLFGLEDVCIVFAMGLSIGLSAIISQQAMHGLGRHMVQVSSHEQVIFLKAFWSGLWVYSLAITVTKVSILVQYLRIFPVHRFRLHCYCLLGLVIAFGGWAAASNIFLCNPVSQSWSIPLTWDHCMDRMLIWYTNSSVNICQDVMIFVLPIPVIRTLQIPASQKRGLMTIFALNWSTSIVSIIRLATIHGIAKSTDLPFDNPAYITLSSLEANAVIICACLPAMRPLLALMMPKYFSTVAQFTNIAMGKDMERLATLEKQRQQSGSRGHELSPSKALGTMDSGASSPQTRQADFRLTTAHSRPSTAGGTPASGRTHYISHSRCASNVSIDIAAADARSNATRPQARIHPLRLSPIMPDRLDGSPSSLPMGVYGVDSSNASHADATFVWSPERLVAAKPLPLTPLPVGTIAEEDR